MKIARIFVLAVIIPYLLTANSMENEQRNQQRNQQNHAKKGTVTSDKRVLCVEYYATL